MLFAKSNSTGKSKFRRSIVMAECLSCPKLKQYNEHQTDSKKPQPVKIAQLLRQAEIAKSTQKHSEHKHILPERLGTFSTIKCARYLETQDSTGIPINHTAFYNKRVRRNLNFNETPIRAPKNNNENKNKSNNEQNYKEISVPMNRKSMLLPPNSIKDKHLQKSPIKAHRYSKIPELTDKNVRSNKKNQIRKETPNTKSNKKVRYKESSSASNSSENIKIHNEYVIAEVSIEFSPNGINANHTELSETPEIATKSLISQCTTNQQIVLHNKDQTLIEKKLLHKSKRHEAHLKDKPRTKAEAKDKCIESLCNDLQNAKMIPEANTNVKSISSDVICIDRNQIMNLELDLKTLLNETEKNVLKLRSTLSCVTRLLSLNHGQILESDINFENRRNCESEKKSNTMLDKEVQVDICFEMLNSQIVMTDKLNTDVNSSVKNDDDNNKENWETLEARKTFDTDESFLELENQLNITHAKRHSMDQLIQQKTPMSAKCKQKRSLKEYMALKSSMTFLETPDTKNFRSLREKTITDEAILHKKYISNKVLTDLHNLYSESPES